MFKRTLTGIVCLPILVFIVAKGAIWLQSFILIFSLIGLWEFYNVLSKKTLPIHFIGYFISIVYILALPYLSMTLLLVLFSFFIITILSVLVIFHENINIMDCTITLTGFFYVVFLFSFIYIVRSNPYGQFMVWLIFISAWGSDTFAYYVGVSMGKHKLCPKLSPKKTIEGSVGGILGATLIAVIYGTILNLAYSVGNFQTVFVFGVIAFFGSAFSQVGDLAASTIKRYTGAKDFGNIFPGHGGVIDRFDSILFTSAGVYIVMNILISIF